MDLFGDDDEERTEDELIGRDGIEGNLDEPLTILNRESLLQQRDPSCSILTFHNGIEDAMLLFVERFLHQNNHKFPANERKLSFEVLRAVDIFCYSRHWMMHIGDQKGQFLDRIVHQLQSHREDLLTCVEIGSYCGYSAVRIASLFQNDQSKLFCIERDAKCLEWTRKLVSLAGLSDRVILINGQCEDGIRFLQQNHLHPIDFLFIDHDKGMYLSDLKLFEATGLLRSPGGIVCADNVLSLGRPLEDYLNHVRGT
jgi:catechol O-methyltransferase